MKGIKKFKKVSRKGNRKRVCEGKIRAFPFHFFLEWLNQGGRVTQPSPLISEHFHHPKEKPHSHWHQFSPLTPSNHCKFLFPWICLFGDFI